MSTHKVRAAVRYYAAYPGEVDDRVSDHREAAAEAEAAWRVEQDLLRGSQTS
ncbi:MAG TPA: hypothetical protein VHH34_03110 [Pseudonocardiaceae bacterium]|nr:hypothetical protein [Pseudonocardiaceae bacterium]